MTAPPDATELATPEKLRADCCQWGSSQCECARCHQRRAAADRIEALESRLASAETALRHYAAFDERFGVEKRARKAGAHFARYATAHRKESGDA
jgi:hypothetical protein